MKTTKLDTLYAFKILGVIIIIATMGVSQFHRPTPIPIPKEMWIMVMAVLTHIFMIMFPQLQTTVVKGGGDWVKGAVTVAMLGMVSASIILGLDIGKEWWGALGVCVAFLYGSHSKSA